MISAYCLGYQHFTVIPHQIEESFKDMREMGFDTVCLTFSESEMRYSRRAFEIQVNSAQKVGLKVHVIPSRLGGRFAGAPLMPSVWLSENPEHTIGERFVACVEEPAFVEWIKNFMKTLLTDYDLDGIVWDEPKSVHRISTHPATIRKLGENPTSEDMIGSFLDFFKDLTDYCRSIKPDLTQTLFAQKTDPELFTGNAAKLPAIEYLGYDGNLSRQSFFHEEPQWHKYRIESVWNRTVEECRHAGKKTFALVENMLMPKEAIAEFETNFDDYLCNYRPDHLSIYYYAHNNEDPERVHRIVRKLMKKHLRP